MENRNLNFYDLSFWQEITRLGEAMQYAFGGDATDNSDYAKENRKYWFEKVLSLTSKSVCAQIQKFKEENAEALENSPILNALLDTYLKVSETKEPEKLRDIYVAFQNLQKDYKFDEHKAEYFDAGCSLAIPFSEGKTVIVTYPISLFGAYTEKGGSCDDHRGGFLFPVHKLTTEELKEIHELRPELFANNPKVQAAYEEAISQPGGPN